MQNFNLMKFCTHTLLAKKNLCQKYPQPSQPSTSTLLSNRKQILQYHYSLPRNHMNFYALLCLCSHDKLQLLSSSSCSTSSCSVVVRQRKPISSLLWFCKLLGVRKIN